MRRTLPESEAAFQGAVLDLAAVHGWSSLHIPPTQLQDRWLTAATKGWPDLVLWKPGQAILFRELKSDRGRVTPDQRHLLDTLARAGGDVDVWRPRDWGTIVSTLAAS